MKKPALSARAHALQLLDHVLRQKRTLDEAVLASNAKLTDGDEKFAMMLTLTVLRHIGQIDAILAKHLDKPLPTKRIAVTNTLRLGVAQLLWLETPSHAAVNETVALIKTGPNNGFSGLVNAVLQAIAREQTEIPVAMHNVPPHVEARWKKAYGKQAFDTMARVAATRPPLDLNTVTEMENATRLDAQMIRLAPDYPAVETLPGFAEGKFFVQDLAASYPARLLGNIAQQQVLDLCAAPGGKTMQLVQASAFVTSLDMTASRLARLRQNLARMQMEANCVTADIMGWQPTRSYDAILLDAPCSATGTWRRHPEVIHLVTDADIKELSTLQHAMLSRAWQWLKPGGKLVYCVCSLEPEEGEAQATQFLNEHADAALVPVSTDTQIPTACISPEGYLRTRPDMLHELGGMDGFFAACFSKLN